MENGHIVMTNTTVVKWKHHTNKSKVAPTIPGNFWTQSLNKSLRKLNRNTN